MTHTPHLGGAKRHIRGVEFVIKGSSRQLLYAAVTGAALNIFINVVNPLGLKLIFDQGISAHNLRFFIVGSFVLLILFTVWRGLDFLHDLYIQRIKATILRSCTTRLLRHYFNLSYSQVKERGPEYFVSRVFDEASSTVAPLVDNIIAMVVALSAVLTGGIIALRLSWRAAVLVAVISPTAYALSHIFSKRIVVEAQGEKEAEAYARRIVFRCLAAFTTVRVFALASFVSGRADRELGVFCEAQEQRYIITHRYRALSGLLLSYAEMSVVIVAGYQVMQNEMTFGAFMAFMTSFWSVIRGAKQVFDTVPELARLNGVAIRLAEITETRELQDPCASSFVDLSDVCFSYEDKVILQNVYLTITPGTKLLIIGDNGSGKSTLCNIICGLLPVTSGSCISINHERISAAVAPFEFPPGSVWDTLLEISQTCARVGLMKVLVQKLEITKIISLEAERMSLGERKKCEIAVVLSKDSDLYILDEPLANIDVKSKDVIVETMFELTEGRSVLVTMHGDVHYYPKFDRILRLHGGQLLDVTYEVKEKNSR